MKNNKIEPAVMILVLAVIVLGCWYIIAGKNMSGVPKVPIQTSEQTPEKQIERPAPILPDGVIVEETLLAPTVVSGYVSKIDGQKITIKGSKEDSIVLVNTKTTFSKQEIDGKSVPATFADIKTSSQLTVYYTSHSGSSYTADKIIIFNMPK